MLFSGGGVASGKTHALAHSAAARSLMAHAEIVQDSTMSTLQRAQPRIDEALAAGRSVQLIYVYAPIEQAVHWLVQRGMRHGRSVPAASMARTHWQSQQTVLALADRYRDDPRVRLQLLINRIGADGLLLPIEQLRPLRYAADPRFPDEAAFSRYVNTLVARELQVRDLDPHPSDPSAELRESLLDHD